MTGTERPRSVRRESDAELLQWAIPFYMRSADRPELWPFEPLIVDVTWGRGRFWRGSPWARNVVGLDMHPGDGAAAGADFRALPLRSGAVDVLVFDPPHVSEQGPRGQVAHRQGFSAHGTEDVTEMFVPFAREAARVLRDGGILLAKVADQVHRCAMRLQHVDWILAAREAGLTVCQCLVKERRTAIMDPRWQAVLHARQVHAFWIVCRKGGC